MHRNRGPGPSARAFSRVRAIAFASVKPGSRRRLPVLCCVVLLALLLALAVSGCGSSDNGVAEKSGKEILAASKAAATGATSVHVVSKGAQGRLTLSIDLTLTRDGGHGRVSFFGLDYEVIRIGDTVYVKGSPAFYAHLGSVLGTALHVPRGMWLKGPVNSGPLAPLAAFADRSGELNRLLSTPGSVIKGASTTVNGQKVIELKEATKVYKGVLYVARTGKPYPVALVKNGRREKGRTTFSEWDKPVSVTAPLPAVDIDTLKR